MRPYLAIIKDSFREAFASRVLWILLVLITLVLLGLAPTGYRMQLTTLFKARDLQDGRELVRKLRRDSANEQPSPAQRIWSGWDEATRESLAEFSQLREESGEAYVQGRNTLLESLNKLLERPDLYEEAAWSTAFLDQETQDLLARPAEELSAIELARRNRLLVIKAYPQHFVSQVPQEVVVTYLGFAVSPPLRFTQQRVDMFIQRFVLAGLMALLVGIVAVLAAILVTAPIIPEMFDPGQLALLLSKPISRSLMFLAKFLGGCAFVTILVSYLIVGLWLVAGLRFGIWNQGLLLCIPIFLFLFAVYYSVSAFSGVIWKNAVVAIVMTVLFWLVCTVVGSAKTIIEQLAIDRLRIVRLVEAGDTLLGVNEQAAVVRWNGAARAWDEVFAGGNAQFSRMLGPVYDASREQVLGAQVSRVGWMSQTPPLWLGKKANDWQQVQGPTLPAGTFTLLAGPKQELLAVTGKQVVQVNPEVGRQSNDLKLMWLRIPLDASGPFKEIGPTPALGLSPPQAAALDPTNGSLAIYSRGTLTVLDRDERGFYRQQKSIELEGDQEQGADLAFAGGTIVLAREDGSILRGPAATLEFTPLEHAESQSRPRFVEASSDGRWFAVVFQNRTLHWLDTAQADAATLVQAPVRGQGNISAVAFPNPEQMLVVDLGTRVRRYALPTCERLEDRAPRRTPIEWVYQYGVLPLYTVFPKPGELGNTVQYLLTKEKTTDMGTQGGDLAAPHVQLTPWRPVVSSLVFIVVVLGAACLYIERQEF